MARINENGFVEVKAGRKNYNKRNYNEKPKDFWLVRDKGTCGYIPFEGKTITFPTHYIGKRIKLKVLKDVIPPN